MRHFVTYEHLKERHMTMFKSGATTGEVKWYDVNKGFGFITASIYGQNEDIFIGRDEARGHEGDLNPGAEVSFSYFTAERGLAVSGVTSVVVPTIELSGTVKWFSPEKGFGYAQTKDGDVRLTAVAVGEHAEVLVPKTPLTMHVVKTDRGLDLHCIVSVKVFQLPDGFVQGKVKMAKGKDFSFIKHDGADIFIHQNTVKEAGAALWDGMELEFRAEMGNNGPHVVAVRPVGADDAVAEVVSVDAEASTEPEAVPSEKPKAKRKPRKTLAQKQAEAAKAADAPTEQSVAAE